MMEFDGVIDSEQALRAIVGMPSERAAHKAVARLDANCRALIAASPFVVVASGDASGHMDASPKGDRPGFVRVLDDETLAIPDRPGNRRHDTFLNVLQNPNVGLLFLIPDKAETLRVNGRGRIVRDGALRAGMAVDGRVPELALVVAVTEAFMHCGKCMLRSALWNADAWPAADGLPKLAQWFRHELPTGQSVEEVQAARERRWRESLY